MLLTAENLSKSYGARTLFEGVDLVVGERDKIGVVGVNGTGKSTMLRLLAGDEPSDSGQISYAKGLRLEYLRQQPDLDDALTALDQVLVDGPPEFEVVRAYEAASRRLAATPDDPELVAEVSRLAERMDRVDGWTLENDAKSILTRLGLDDLDKPVGTMSGGQRRRVALARALVRPSDLLILDEPTNHLDVDSVEWLESYLMGRTGGLLMVTHDRYFLDRVCETIVELDGQTLHRYAGSYSIYLEKRAERHELLRKREEKRQNLARQELEWLRRGPKARTSKSKVRVERAHALQESLLDEERGDVEIDTVESRLGKKTVFLEHVRKAWDGNTVIADFTYRFSRQDRLGIVGPNGAGKSTLLDIITGRTEPDAGTVERGETVVFGYYDQEAMDLDADERVHDYIVGISNKIETADGFLTATQMLEKFLFARDRQWEPIGNLSGGERRRLYLLGVLMRSPNFLLLDEPTNDLDIETLNILEDYLDSFSGALVVVSHDRHFLDRAVDHLLVFDDAGGIERFPGSYTPWIEHRKAQQAAEAAERRAEREAAEAARAAAAPAAAPKPRKLSYRESQELDALEARIEAVETRLANIEQAMVDQAADYEAVRALADEQADLQTELEAAMDRWAELAERA